mmetsp:Transcript_32495/g.56188  ORF Transcript_32495/g.56188 Transcript_32495/m.56188 type:complete len:201 (-) Transcript_32495:44-646(-)
MKTFKNMKTNDTSRKLLTEAGFTELKKHASELLRKGYEPTALAKAFEQMVTSATKEIENAENLPTADSVSSRVSLKLPSQSSRNPSLTSFAKLHTEDSKQSKTARLRQSRKDNPLSKSLSSFSEFSHISIGASFGKASKGVKFNEISAPGPATYHCKVSLIQAHSPTIPKGGKRIEFAKKDPVPGPGSYKPMHYALSRNV